MNMDNQEEKSYQSQGDRIPQGSAHGFSIVPAEPASSSDNGLGSTLPTSGGPESTIVEEVQDGGRASDLAPDVPATEKDATPAKASDKEVERMDSLEESSRAGEEIETASIVSGGTAMECDEVRATKRKKSRSTDRHSSEESEEEALKRVKVSRKQRILTDETFAHWTRNQSRSDPDLSVRPSEEDVRIMKMKKGYISKQKRLEIEEAKEEIANKKREENRRKKEEKLKEEEEKRKREDRIKAENSVLAKIKVMPAAEKDYIENMTASDVAAMALEYLEHVETIRTKCGTMQGALSGELKRRKLSLDNMVKALQAKAEENGDPIFLKAKIDELIKKNREEERRKSNEINELKEIVNTLKKENKEMKRELKLIKEDMKRREETQKVTRQEKVEVHTYRNGDTYRNDDDALENPVYSAMPCTRKETPSSTDEGPVLRPPLKGRSTPIPNSSLKQEEKIRIREKVEGVGKRMDIKVKEDIQIKPPRREVRTMDIYKEKVDQEKEENMEWEEGGIDWKEETYKNEGQTKDGDRDMQEGVTENKGKVKEKEEWSEVVRKGNKKKRLQEEKKMVTKKPNTSNEVKRKLPRTAAVSIKGDVGKGFSYADALRKARTRIKMEELQIEAPRIRKGLNGATIIEISGPDCGNKAQHLANKLQEVLSEEMAIITTPIIKGDLRITGLEESIDKEDIRWAIEEEGGCEGKDVKVGEIIRNRRGMGTVWIRCPLKAAMVVAKKKKLKIGWTIVGVTLLKARPLQCYRCWQYGHVKDMCRSTTDRSKCCFQCGSKGHTAAMCKNEVKCAICTDLGKDNTHRVGSVKCEGVRPRVMKEEQARRANPVVGT